MLVEDTDFRRRWAYPAPTTLLGSRSGISAESAGGRFWGLGHCARAPPRPIRYGRDL